MWKGFDGLFILTVAIAVNVYARLIEQPAPKARLLVMSLLSQAALVLTHVLGIIYGGLILLALILSDASRRRVRPRVYLSYAAGWLALLVWVPAIRTSMAAGKPSSWIMMPSFKTLVASYLFDAFDQWFGLLQRHSQEATFQMIRHAAEWIIPIPLTLILLLGLRRLVRTRQQAGSADRSAFLLVGYFVFSTPVILFVVSHLINPAFVSRYLLPCGVGIAIILADFAEARGAGSQASSRWLWGSVVVLLVICPVVTTLALPPLDIRQQYPHVQRLDRVSPALPRSSRVGRRTSQNLCASLTIRRIATISYSTGRQQWKGPEGLRSTTV